MIKYLTFGQVIQIHDVLLEKFGGLPGLRDENLLLSALEAPKLVLGGTEIYPSIHEKGAAYLFFLARNHPFNDGNKRTAYFCTRMFLELNNVRLTFKKEKLEDLVVDVAQGKINKDKIALFLKNLP
jgi:death-on-curing protein